MHAIVHTLLYVLPLYATKQSRPSSQRLSSSPNVIKARIITVALSCIFCVLLNSKVVHNSNLISVAGLSNCSPGDILHCLLLTSILFLGPLVRLVGLGKDFLHWHELSPMSLVTFRNYIFVGILTKLLIV